MHPPHHRLDLAHHRRGVHPGREHPLREATLADGTQLAAEGAVDGSGHALGDGFNELDPGGHGLLDPFGTRPGHPCESRCGEFGDRVKPQVRDTDGVRHLTCALLRDARVAVGGNHLAGQVGDRRGVKATVGVASAREQRLELTGHHRHHLRVDLLQTGSAQHLPQLRRQVGAAGEVLDQLLDLGGQAELIVGGCGLVVAGHDVSSEPERMGAPYPTMTRRDWFPSEEFDERPGTS